MKAYAFQFLLEDDKPSDWYGLAVADTLTKLYWMIDQHGDPHNCKILEIDYHFSVCYKLENPVDEHDVDAEIVECEWHGSTPHIFTMTDWDNAKMFSEYNYKNESVRLIKYRK